jgi:RNA polymerase sigma-70 factor (ECF subfamily)
MDFSRQDLARLVGGDPGALGTLYEVHGARVYRVCRGLLGQDADAEDATQEVFLRILDKIGSFDGRARLSTWIFRVTTNLCLNRLGRRRVQEPLEGADADLPPAAGPSPLELAARAESGEVMARLLGPLAPEQRAVLVLREAEGLSYREIGAVLDIPEGTVMSRLHRARERLLATHSNTLPVRDAP